MKLATLIDGTTCSLLGPAPQPSTVVISGTNVEESLTFDASTHYNFINVAINDDQVSLEDVEQYQLTFVGTNSDRVNFGDPTLIRITDDDRKFFHITHSID